MFEKDLIRIFMVLSVFFYSSVFAAISNGIVINEIKVSGETATDEYVKFYNPTVTEISLTGYKLIKITTSGAKYTLVSSFGIGMSVKPKSFFIVASKDFKGGKDFIYTSSSYSLASDNAVVLQKDHGKTEVDRVGYGKNIYGESESAQGPLAGEILKRMVDGEDTDNNKNDFMIEGNQADQNQNDGAKDISGVYINELLPNPKAPETDAKDEWIELFNETNIKIDLSGAILRDSSKEYIVPPGIFINPGGYAVFYSRDIKISLNNTGEVVELLDNRRNLISSVPDYGNAKDGYSFSFFAEGWDWTLIATPLAENIFYSIEKPEKEKNSKVKKDSVKKNTSASEKSTSKKAASKKTAVKGSSKQNDVENTELDDKIVKGTSLKNKNMGYFLVFLGLFLLANYISNREKFNEIFKRKFGRDL